jgi:hypothetical protein
MSSMFSTFLLNPNSSFPIVSCRLPSRSAGFAPAVGKGTEEEILEEWVGHHCAI